MKTSSLKDATSQSASTDAPEVRPIESILTSVPPVAALASRLIYDGRFGEALGRIVQGCTLVPLASAPARPYLWLEVEADQGTLVLLLGADGRADWRAMAVDAAKLSEPMQKLAAEALFAPMLKALRALGMNGACARSLWAADTTASRVSVGGWCTAEDSKGSQITFAVSSVSAAVLIALRQQLRPPRRSSLWRRSLSLSGAAVLASRCVKRTTLDRLGSGDVLLLDGPTTLTQINRCQVRFGGRGSRQWCAYAQVDETTITLRQEAAMHDDTDDIDEEGMDAAEQCFATAGSATADVDAIESLTIPVRFEIATEPLTLSEIETMSPGFVIELRTPLAMAQVRLVAAGQVIGQAELVAVGDRLGARILRMALVDV